MPGLRRLVRSFCRAKQSEYSGTCPRTEQDHLRRQTLTDLSLSLCVILHVICVYADAPWVWQINESLNQADLQED